MIGPDTADVKKEIFCLIKKKCFAPSVISVSSMRIYVLRKLWFALFSQCGTTVNKRHVMVLPHKPKGGHAYHI